MIGGALPFWDPPFLRILGKFCYICDVFGAFVAMGKSEKIIKDSGGIVETPLMKQYFEVKAKYPEAILLFRVGDFYETFGEDAVTASKVLGIVLTKRANGYAASVDLAGFPHHSIDLYLPKLVRAGYKVAVCDQLEDPKLTKKIVKRGVTELVTPGVAYNEQLLDCRENNFLASLAFEKDKVGMAFLDISTGTFKVAQGNLEYAEMLVSSFAPKELLVPRGYEKGVKEHFGDKYYISTLDEWAFVYDSSYRKLSRQLGVDSLKGFGVSKMPLGVAAAGAVLVYLEHTEHSNIGHICSVSRIDEGDYVWMDRFTVRNLEIFSSTAGHDGVALLDVMDKCSSPMGSRLLRNWLAMPIMDVNALEGRYDAVSYFIENKDILNDLKESLGNIGDLERIISRAAAGRISPREMMQLKRGLKQGELIKALCSRKEVPSLEALVSQIDVCSDLVSLIEKTIADDPAAAIGKGPVIASGVNPELDDLRNLADHSKEYLLNIQQREIERTGIPSLKIGYNSVFGYYLEVRNTYKDKAPEEWVRKQTLVNAERYITEELKEYESRILGAQERIYNLENAIYQEVISAIRDKVPVIRKNCDAIAAIDILSTFAVSAISHNYCRPQMSRGHSLDITAGRHPVIETLMPVGEEYVANDLHLDNSGQQIIILTGPNMAGKSALLRQTALIVLMAQIGSFVPASSAKIGVVDKIFTRVGASDNISRGESTFMVEMTETAMILHNLSERSLVLLDEIGRGTSTYDGMSIARAIVQYIHEDGKGAKTLFATHYHELNDLEQIYPRVKNFHIAVKEVDNQVIFLRKLLPGGVAHSFGIHVARMAGMPRKVISMAERTLKALEDGRPDKDVSKRGTVREGKVEADGSIQLSLFQLEDPLLMTLRDTLNDVDINNITPLQAFDLLRELKRKMGI